MKVRDCEQLCDQYERRTWSHKHYSANYHAVGMTHAYGYCLRHQKRCSEVKGCDMNKREVCAELSESESGREITE